MGLTKTRRLLIRWSPLVSKSASKCHDGKMLVPSTRNREETKMNITTIGLDLAKNVFHVVCFDNRGKELKKTEVTA